MQQHDTARNSVGAWQDWSARRDCGSDAACVGRRKHAAGQQCACDAPHRRAVHEPRPPGSRLAVTFATSTLSSRRASISEPTGASAL